MLNILIIADDAIRLPSLSEALALHIPKARVDWHQIVGTAMGQIQSRTYHLIVIDTHGPAEDSLALLSQISDLQPNALTILATDRQDHAFAVEAFQCGAYDCVTRPPDQYLVASLKRAVKSFQLTDLNRLKDELFGGISHALRTHLNSILNWAQLMRSGKLDEPTCSLAFEMIERGIKEQAKLLERIDDLPRAIIADLQVPFEPMGRTALVKQLLEPGRADASARTQETSVPGAEGRTLSTKV